MATNMTPNRPYLIRAFYDWIVDNDLTPYLLVDAMVDGVQVPSQFVKDGQIVLNIAPHAVAGLDVGLDAISFSARFGGVAYQVYIPCWAVQAIYARENGAGTMFSDEEYSTAPAEPAPKPGLAVVEEERNADTADLADSADSAEPEAAEVETPTEPAPRPRGRPTLTLVK